MLSNYLPKANKLKLRSANVGRSSVEREPFGVHPAFSELFQFSAKMNPSKDTHQDCL